MTALTFVSDKPLGSLRVGDVAKITISLNGAPITGGTVQWAETVTGVLKCDPLPGSTIPGQVAQLTALKTGTIGLICIYNGTILSAVANVTVAPGALPAGSAPALLWSLNRPHISMTHTDFNYNWDQPHDWQGTVPTPMEVLYAHRYDVSFSGSPYRQARLKKVNPNIRCIPYALLLTTLTDAAGAPNINTEYCDDFAAWNGAHGISAADAEAGWLHFPGQSGVAGRVTKFTWNSPRNLPDPTNANMRAYQIDRLKRVCAPAWTDGVFLDEYGSNMNRADYALSCTLNGVTDTVRLQALCDAQTTLLAAISAAMYPKQLVINTAAYEFGWDAQETKAARGTHMEQTNDAMPLDLWASTWPYVDARLAEGDFVNQVPLRDWGGYDGLHDGLVPANYMSTIRGKTIELASYFMCVTGAPQQLSLSIENGRWGDFTPVANWLPAIDVSIGHPLAARHVVSGSPAFVGRGHCFLRSFDHGLVAANMTPDRLAPNYGTAGGGTLTLPTDRVYAPVKSDGTIGAPVATVYLRCPEAQIFVAVP